MAPAKLETTDRPIPVRARPWLAAVLLIATGCQSMPGPLARLRAKHDESYAYGAPRPENVTDRSLLARWLTPNKTPHASKSSSSLVLGDGGWSPLKVKPDPAADAELAEAQKLAQDGKASEAESRFSRIARRRKGTPWGEKAQFYLAESQFNRGKLVDAHDSYEVLIKDYPGTEFLDQLVKREYEIGKTWLDPYKPGAKPEVQPTTFDRLNGKFPMVDASGHGLKALEHVRMHDPTGPLSDDAVKRTADFHREAGNHESAALFYDQLVTDHPKSPFLRDAQVASVEEKLKAYWGPDYDGRNLDGAREMIKQTMAAFPERQDSDHLYKKLDLIGDQEAERAYRVGEYYMRTGKVVSAEYYFGMVIAKWPKNEWAAKAKTHMAVLAKMDRKKWAPSTIMSAPGGADPFGSTGGGQGPSSAGPNGLPNAF